VSIPIAAPSVVMDVGIVCWYLVVPVHLYRPLLILIVAFVTISLLSLAGGSSSSSSR